MSNKMVGLFTACLVKNLFLAPSDIDFKVRFTEYMSTYPKETVPITVAKNKQKKRHKTSTNSIFLTATLIFRVEKITQKQINHHQKTGSPKPSQLHFTFAFHIYSLICCIAVLHRWRLLHSTESELIVSLGQRGLKQWVTFQQKKKHISLTKCFSDSTLLLIFEKGNILPIKHNAIHRCQNQLLGLNDCRI